MSLNELLIPKNSQDLKDLKRIQMILNGPKGYQKILKISKRIQKNPKRCQNIAKESKRFQKIQ